MNITEEKFDKFIELKDSGTDLTKHFSKAEVEYMTKNYKQLWVRWRI